MATLAAMGIAEEVGDEDDPSYHRIRLHPDAVALVTRVATEPDSRFRALARTLLDIERGRVSVIAGVRSGVDRTDLHYARSVAHEIRNLLLPLSTALTGLWEELAQPAPTPERRQKLRERIIRSVDRLGEFATEAVKLSAAVAEEELQVAEVVAAAVRATESERNGRIQVEVEVGPTRITGSARDWTSVFVNLLRNATQVRAGAGTVWISAAPDTLGGCHLYVDDDGPGVPEELREQIFDSGHSTRGGTGLGLAEARRTALLAGGTLTCEVAPQGGARFHFHLPRRSGA